MNLQTEILYDVGNKTWDDILLSNKASTVYQSADFYQPYKLAFNSKPVFITVSNSSGKIVGQLSAVIHVNSYWLDSYLSRQIPSMLNLGSRLSWIYGPIIHDADHSEEILSSILTAIDKIAIQNNVNVIRGSSPTLMQLPADIFRKNGYAITPWITYITDLQRNVDDVYSDLSRSVRRNIQKGQKMGLEFEIISGKESYQIFLEIKRGEEKKLEKIKKRYREFNNHAWRILQQNDHEKLFLVKYEGKPTSIIIGGLFNKNIVQVSLGNIKNGNRYAGIFLTWNVIRWSIENNFKTFDLTGAHPNPVIEKEKNIKLFKSQWANKEFDYFFCTKIFNRTKYNISKVIQQPSSLTRRIFSRNI